MNVDHPQPTSQHIPGRKRIVVAMTGATGALMGIKTLIALRRLHVGTRLIISKWASQTIAYETDYTQCNVRTLAGSFL
ncbi:hypothetical protein CNMCM6106_001574 [Aspergillus hiratsukae]|uniref:Flavoprotein domain-containing protein n=1 Tax=Aspergillus hiratsukae TaxID=1194566 RepID=A0A8H6Q430_9EURO|nr:hypothetical protein CNMCM6106_001574 [Aspergillus hiratsukae]